MHTLRRMVIYILLSWSLKHGRTTLTTPSGFTLDFQSEVQVSCLKNVRSFVHRKGLCESSDVVESQKPQSKSCANRCGTSRGYGSFLPCACDEKCVVYDDCCIDMSTKCPEVHSRGINEVGYFDGANPTCFGSSILVNENVHAWATKPIFAYSTQSQVEMTTLQDGFSTRGNISLDNIMEDINAFKVVDTKFGIVFSDFFSFSSWEIPIQRMAVVPQITTLGCIKANIGALDRRNLLRILPSCIGVAMLTIPTVFDRSCKYDDLISCVCERTMQVSSFLRDACFSQTKLDKNFSFTRKFKPLRDDHNLCSLNKVSLSFRGPGSVYRREELKIAPPWTGSIGIDQIVVPVSVTPILDLAKLSKPDFIDRSFDKTAPQQKTLKNLPLQFVMDMQETPERRLRCTTFTGPLSECQLEKCTDGVFLVARPLSPWALGGYVCASPALAVVEGNGRDSRIGLCNCLRMLNTIADLKVWGVKLGNVWHGQCVLQLKAISQEPDISLEIYNFSTAHFSKPTEKKILRPLSIQNLKDKLVDQMKQTRGSCIEDMPESTQICFYSWKSELIRERELIVCVPLLFTSLAWKGHTVNVLGLIVISILVVTLTTCLRQPR